MKINNIFGWLGSTLLAFCGLPEAIRAISSPSYDISLAFVLLWGFGELFEWIVEAGKVVHRFFVPGGGVNGVPIVP